MLLCSDSAIAFICGFMMQIVNHPTCPPPDPNPLSLEVFQTLPPDGWNPDTQLAGVMPKEPQQQELQETKTVPSTTMIDRWLRLPKKGGAGSPRSRSPGTGGNGPPRSDSDGRRRSLGCRIAIETLHMKCGWAFWPAGSRTS